MADGRSAAAAAAVRSDAHAAIFSRQLRRMIQVQKTHAPPVN